MNKGSPKYLKGDKVIYIFPRTYLKGEVLIVEKPLGDTLLVNLSELSLEAQIDAWADPMSRFNREYELLTIVKLEDVVKYNKLTKVLYVK